MSVIGFIILVFVVIGALSGKRGKRRKISAPRQVRKRAAAPPPRVQVQVKMPQQPAPQRLPAQPFFKWHPPGESLALAGHTISAGMVYSGRSAEYQSDGSGCIIDPALPVARESIAGEKLSYWPSYKSISSTARFTYLSWLSSGRSDPNIDIGYVFLFFYGLERRLLIDHPPQAEKELLVAEIVRLRSLYSSNHSFAGYSQNLLDAVEFSKLLSDPVLTEGFEPDLMASPGRMPLLLKVAIARKVIAETPLTFEFAAAGLLRLPWDAMPRNDTVLQYARVEFLNMLRSRFDKAFPAGFKLRNRKNSRLRLDYHPASMGLRVSQDIAPNPEVLPDPATLTWTKLANLAIQISAELEPYAKVVAYHPERSDSLLALAVCPKDIAGTVAPKARSWNEALTGPICGVRFGDLALHAIGSKGAKWTLRHHRLAADALSKMGRGMEPDPVDGSETLTDDTEVFVITDSVCLAPRSQNFGVAAAAAILVAGMARASAGRGTSVEETWLELARQRMNLLPGDILRLRARLHWLRHSNSGLAKAKRLLSGVTQADRETVAWSAAVAAAAGGLVEKSQIALLETICDKLDVSRRSLYTAIHSAVASAAVPALEPVTVSVDASASIHSIPKAPQPEKPGLDEERLRLVRLETERVSSVLAEIFMEEGPEPPLSVSEAEGSGPFSGLDAAHAAFVAKLMSAPVWSREAFDIAAREFGLMPDGCMEAINEWAFDHFDEPFIEGDEMLTVNVSLLGPKDEHADAA